MNLLFSMPCFNERCCLESIMINMILWRNMLTIIDISATSIRTIFIMIWRKVQCFNCLRSKMDRLSVRVLEIKFININEPVSCFWHWLTGCSSNVISPESAFAKVGSWITTDQWSSTMKSTTHKCRNHDTVLKKHTWDLVVGPPVNPLLAFLSWTAKVADKIGQRATVIEIPRPGRPPSYN